MIKVKTGEKAPVSGQYKIKGGQTEITLIQGKRVPPSASGITQFTLVDKTRHSKWGVHMRRKINSNLNYAGGCI